MNIETFLQEYPQYSDLPPEELADKLHASLFSDIPRDQFNAVFLGGGQRSPDEQDMSADMDGDMGEMMPEEPPMLEYTSNNVPMDQNRLDFEIGLLKNRKTSKTAVLLPASTTPQDAMALAKGAKLLALKEGAEIYLYDPKQITERALRSQVKSGKNGHALGYGTDAVPEGGVPYAVNLDGNGVMDPRAIVDLQQSGQLGFSGVAPDAEFAAAKIREMGRDDAEIS